MSEYLGIREGMTYEEVSRIIGTRGSEVSSTSAEGYKLVSYSWQNENGSNMIALFENNRLTTKSQFGLN